MKARLAGAVLLAFAAATSPAQEERTPPPPVETKTTPEAKAALARMNAVMDRPVDHGLKSMKGDVDVNSATGPSTVHVEFSAPATFATESTDWLGHRTLRAVLKAAMNGVAPIDGVPDLAEMAKKDGVDLLVFTSRNVDGGTSRSEYSLDAAGLPTSAANFRKRTVNGAEREDVSTARFVWAKAGDKFRLTRLEFGDARTTTTEATIGYQEFDAIAIPTTLKIELGGGDRTYECRFNALWLDGKKVELKFDDDASRAAAAEVESKVREILAVHRDSNKEAVPDPCRPQLVALGRAAVPALLKVICDDDLSVRGMMKSSAAKALPELVADGDAEMLARRMREGHRELEYSFARLRAPTSLLVYASLIREGCFSYGLVEVVSQHLSDEDVVDGCCGWLAAPKYDGDKDWAITMMANIAAAFGPRAVAPLQALFQKPLRSDARIAVATALVRLGDKDAIPAVIDTFAAPVDEPGARPDGLHRHLAGNLLNAVSGTRLYVGRVVYDFPKGKTNWTGNFDEAAKGFREWWKKSKDALRFDPVARTWSVQ